jgi:sugar O-acyltransferase (sialic acid O-acetyltransferase NeuD family)
MTRSSSLRPLVFLGASTAFDEIVEVVRDINAQTPRWDVVAVLDDAEQVQGTTVQGVPVEGQLDEWTRFPDAEFVFAIGSHRTRMLRLAILDRLRIPESRFPPLIHPRAKIYANAGVRAGSIVHMNAVVLAGAVLEPFAIVTFNAILGPKAAMRRGAMLASAAIALTGVEIGSCAFVGAASCIAEGVRIGPGAMVGMGTHVYRDVQPGAFVFGNPPREVRRDDVPPALLSAWGGQPREPDQVPSW